MSDIVYCCNECNQNQPRDRFCGAPGACSNCGKQRFTKPVHVLCPQCSTKQQRCEKCGKSTVVDDDGKEIGAQG